MKSTFYSFLALPALFLGALAAPASEPALVARSKVSDDYAIVSALYTQALQYDAAINKTAASITSASTAAQNATAAAAIKSDMENMITAINAATTKIKAVNAESSSKRQSTPAAQLEALVEALAAEVGGTVAGILAMGNPLVNLIGTTTNQLLGALVAMSGPLAGVVAGIQQLVIKLLTGLLGSL